MAFNLEEVDVDGAIQEAADAVGDTRLSFLKKGALAGGAALGSGAVLGALLPGTSMAATSHQTTPPSSFGAGDIGILNYALTLEYLESTFYDQAASHHLGYGSREVTAILGTTKRDEAAHVAKLKGALGSMAVKKPTFDFGKAVTDKKTFLETAYAVENLGVHAYLGQAPNIKNPAYLLVAASIVTIEARHSAAWGTYLGRAIAPSGPFDTGYSAAKVLAAVGKTKFIKS